VKTLYLLIAAVGVISLVVVSPGAAQDKQVVGWLEKVRIYPGDFVIIAKLDTGAKNSSLNASRITEVERGGERWVRFKVTDRYGKTVTIERKVHRIVKIKEADGTPQLRLAILLGICLGSFYKEVEVNLADRTHFNYQMLIGRSFLQGNVIVDPSIKFTTKPICRGVPGQ
jgi:hypothetical protein